MRFFFITAMCAVVIFSAGCGPDETAASLLKKSLSFAQKADWKQSLKYAEQARAKDASDTRLIALNALALENTECREEALNMILRIDPACEQFFPLYTMGRLLYASGKYDQCIKPLSAALRIKPDDPNTLILLANASVRLRTKDALTYNKRLIGLKDFKKSAAPWNELGVTLVCHNQPAKALPFFLNALRLEENNPDVILNTAIVYDYYLNNVTAAAEYYNRYLKLTANHSEFEKDRNDVNQRLQTLH